MTVGEWARTTARQVRAGDVDGLRDSAYQLYTGGLRRAGRLYNYGTPIYESDWDLMIALDACRPDLMAEVAAEYDFVDEETAVSVGSATEEWIEKTFIEAYREEIRETVYVTGNPHSSEGLDGPQFRHLEEVWAHSWDDDLGSVRAETVTDYAIAAGREFDPDRLLVHYMQPHHPFVPTPELNEGIGFDPDTEYDHIWQKLRHGDISREAVWEGYVENLRYVLDSVATLLDNVDAETAVITSDHGNAMGEYGIYGHPMYVPIDALKRVPYCRTTARDTGDRIPDCELSGVGSETDDAVDERLQDLGYV